MDANTKLAYDKAQARAREMGGADKVHPLGDSRYSVLSSNGRDFYTVEVVSKATQDVFVCNCKAGQNARLCWHKPAVFAYRTREAMREAVKASAPATAQTPGQRAVAELWS